jgi:hypothetical protein
MIHHEKTRGTTVVQLSGEVIRSDYGVVALSTGPRVLYLNHSISYGRMGQWTGSSPRAYVHIFSCCMKRKMLTAGRVTRLSFAI